MSSNTSAESIMTEQQITNAKMDHQTKLLWYILAGVGGAIVSGATWMGSQFVQDKSFLRDDVKTALKEIGTAMVSIANSEAVQVANQKSDQQVVIRAIENQTSVLRELTEVTRRGDWREAPPAKAVPPP